MRVVEINAASGKLQGGFIDVLEGEEVKIVSNVLLHPMVDEEDTDIVFFWENQKILLPPLSVFIGKPLPPEAGNGGLGTTWSMELSSGDVNQPPAQPLQDTVHPVEVTVDGVLVNHQIYEDEGLDSLALDLGSEIPSLGGVIRVKHRLAPWFTRVEDGIVLRPSSSEDFKTCWLSSDSVSGRIKVIVRKRRIAPADGAVAAIAPDHLVARGPKLLKILSDNIEYASGPAGPMETLFSAPWTRDRDTADRDTLISKLNNLMPDHEFSEMVGDPSLAIWASGPHSAHRGTRSSFKHASLVLTGVEAERTWASEKMIMTASAEEFFFETMVILDPTDVVSLRLPGYDQAVEAMNQEPDFSTWIGCDIYSPSGATAMCEGAEKFTVGQITMTVITMRSRFGDFSLGDLVTAVGRDGVLRPRGTVHEQVLTWSFDGVNSPGTTWRTGDPVVFQQQTFQAGDAGEIDVIPPETWVEVSGPVSRGPSLGVNQDTSLSIMTLINGERFQETLWSPVMSVIRREKKEKVLASSDSSESGSVTRSKFVNEHATNIKTRSEIESVTGFSTRPLVPLGYTYRTIHEDDPSLCCAIGETLHATMVGTETTVYVGEFSSFYDIDVFKNSVTQRLEDSEIDEISFLEFEPSDSKRWTIASVSGVNRDDEIVVTKAEIMKKISADEAVTSIPVVVYTRELVPENEESTTPQPDVASCLFSWAADNGYIGETLILKISRNEDVNRTLFIPGTQVIQGDDKMSVVSSIVDDDDFLWILLAADDGVVPEDFFLATSTSINVRIR